MNNHKNIYRVIHSSLAFALALTIWSPIQARSAEPAKEKMKMEGKKMMGSKTKSGTEMTQHCQSMKDQMEKIMADTKTQDEELTSQISAMNNAPEDKKLDMMAAVVTLMAEQQVAMQSRKAKIEKMMVPHMMQHMQMGEESMAQCPMMKGMKGMDEKSIDAHKEHKTE